MVHRREQMVHRRESVLWGHRSLGVLEGVGSTEWGGLSQVGQFLSLECMKCFVLLI